MQDYIRKLQRKDIKKKDKIAIYDENGQILPEADAIKEVVFWDT